MQHLFNIIKLLPKKLKICIYFFIPINIVLAFTELMSLASITTIIINILDLEGNNNNNFYIFFFKLTETINFKNINLFVFIFFIFFIFFSWIFKIINLRLSLHVTNYISSNLQILIFKKYISQSFDNFVVEKHSEVLSKLTLITYRASFYLESFFYLVSSIIISFFILIFLSLINPILTISIVVLLILFFLFVYLLKSKSLQKKGEKISIAQKKLVKIFNNTQGFMNEIELYGFKENYIEKFEIASKNIAKNIIENKIIGGSPRIHLEYFVLFFLIISIFSVRSFFPNYNFDLFYIVAVAISAQKILPLANKIYTSIAEMKSTEAAFIETSNYCKGIKVNQINNYTKNYQNSYLVKFNKKIELKNICFKYISGNHNVINNLSFSIKHGTFFGIKGESGSGKTTLLNLIAFLLKPNSGKIIVDDNEINDLNFLSWRNNISIVNQIPFLKNETIKENIALDQKVEEIDKLKISKCINIACVNDFIKEFELKENHKVHENGGNLSGGQRQRIAIARALYRQSKIIILDEPTSGLDKKTEIKLLNNLKELKNVTFIIVSHSERVLSFCDDLISIDNR